jgi:heme oxygenase
MRGKGRLTELFDPRLDRLSAIDHDLAGLAGLAGLARSDGEGLTEPVAATAAYVRRIVDVATSEPRLLGHHYVRYLGDLSGGQIIASLMRRHYGIPDEALTFYAFVGLGSKGGFKTAYRRALDVRLADPGFYAEVLDESRRAYELNRSVFEELGRGG